MAVTYSKFSPYYKTNRYNFFLDVAQIPKIPVDVSDVLYEIDAVYKYRPDILAYDLYGDTNLWWVFAIRNPNVIKDPIFDFSPGTKIYIPKKEVLKSNLGI